MYKDRYHRVSTELDHLATRSVDSVYHHAKEAI
jgi:hypothetical protein